MNEGQWALAGVFLGGVIGLGGSLGIAWLQLRYDDHRQRIDRTVDIYKHTLQAGCELLDALLQTEGRDVEDLRPWQDRQRQGFVSHWHTVGLLRLLGDDVIADAAVQFFGYVDTTIQQNRAYPNTEDGWTDIRTRAYRLIDLMEDRMARLEYGASLTGAVGQLRELAGRLP